VKYQGDQIGRIFAYWTLFSLGRGSPKFWATFSHGKVVPRYMNLDEKMLGCFLAIVSQTHPVTLSGYDVSLPNDVSPNDVLPNDVSPNNVSPKSTESTVRLMTFCLNVSLPNA
jgi:hypothetical protein